MPKDPENLKDATLFALAAIRDHLGDGLLSPMGIVVMLASVCYDGLYLYIWYGNLSNEITLWNLAGLAVLNALGFWAAKLRLK